MNTKLIEYHQRFQKNTTTKESPKFESFFTQLQLSEYSQKLPYLFEIENFCLRLYLALKKDEKVCIYSDYDTDAVTATATMYHGLINFGFKTENIGFYAPDRFIEGYGINPEAIKKLSDFYNLIISVDCGINSTEEAKIVQDSKNCDLLITDHHHLHSEIPRALAVINPRLSEFYSKDSKVFKTRKIYLEQILANFNVEQKKIFKNWLKKVTKKPKDYIQNYQNFLSQSSTGVGVAWFSLVWFGYFLEELENLR